MMPQTREDPNITWETFYQFSTENVCGKLLICEVEVEKTNYQ